MLRCQFASLQSIVKSRARLCLASDNPYLLSSAIHLLFHCHRPNERNPHLCPIHCIRQRIRYAPNTPTWLAQSKRMPFAVHCEFFRQECKFFVLPPRWQSLHHSNVLVLRRRCTRRFDDDVIGTAFITFVALAYDIFRIFILRPTTLYTIGITNIIAAFVFSSAVCCNDFLFIVCIFRNDITMTFAFEIATSGDAVGII